MKSTQKKLKKFNFSGIANILAIKFDQNYNCFKIQHDILKDGLL